MKKRALLLLITMVSGLTSFATLLLPTPALANDRGYHYVCSGGEMITLTGNTLSCESTVVPGKSGEDDTVTVSCPGDQDATHTAEGQKNLTINCNKGGAAKVALTPAADPNSSPDDKCAVESTSLGWLVCPVIVFLNKAVGLMTRNVIVPLLTFDSNQPGLLPVWGVFRNLANVLFVLVFLAIIFASTLSLEIDAYTVKKALPKLIAATVLVQASFFLSGVIVDIGNIFGNGIPALINFALNSANVNVGQSVVGHELTNTRYMMEALGVAITGVAVAGAFAIIGPATILLMVGVGFLSLLGTLFTLAVRRLILAILIVLSPLAFVAMVLPATEKYYKLWRESLITLVMMYPIIMLLLSMAHVLSSIQLGTNNPGGIKATAEVVDQILAAAFPIIAFLLIPATFKLARGTIGKLTGMFGGKSMASRLKGSQLAEGIKADRQEKGFIKATDANETRFGKALGRTRAGGIGSFRNTRLTQRKMASGGEAARAALQKDEGARLEQLKLDNPDYGKIALAKAGDTVILSDGRPVKLNEESRQAAISHLAANGGIPELIEIYDKDTKQGGLGLRDLHSQYRALKSPVDKMVELQNKATAGTITTIEQTELADLNAGRDLQVRQTMLQNKATAGTITDSERTELTTLNAGIRGDLASRQTMLKPVAEDYKEKRELWDRALGSNKANVLQKAPHLVHAKGIEAYQDSNGSMLVNAHSKNAPDLVSGAVETTEGQQKLLSSMSAVGQSPAMRAQIDQAMVKEFYNAVQAGKMVGTTVRLGSTDYTAEEFARDFIGVQTDTAGNVTGYDFREVREP